MNGTITIRLGSRICAKFWAQILDHCYDETLNTCHIFSAPPFLSKSTHNNKKGVRPGYRTGCPFSGYSPSEHRVQPERRPQRDPHAPERTHHCLWVPFSTLREEPHPVFPKCPSATLQRHHQYGGATYFCSFNPTDVDTSKLTKSVPCQHIALSLWCLDESNNSIPLSEGEDNEKGSAVDLETASLCASPLSKAECKNVFLSSQAHSGMEWVEILWLGIQWNDLPKTTQPLIEVLEKMTK